MDEQTTVLFSNNLAHNEQRIFLHYACVAVFLVLVNLRLISSPSRALYCLQLPRRLVVEPAHSCLLSFSLHTQTHTQNNTLLPIPRCFLHYNISLLLLFSNLLYYFSDLSPLPTYLHSFFSLSLFLL